MGREHVKVKSRGESFVQRTVTRIWDEQATEYNPYLTESCRCHGYDLMELVKKRSFVDMLYLLFKGELPSADQSQLLESLMVALINPGPRHPATRAAMNAGVGKTDPAHILPIALTILGGEHLGAGEIEGAMRFLRKESRNNPVQVAENLIAHNLAPQDGGDWHIVPGFGCRFGDIEPMPRKIAECLAELPGSGNSLQWGNAFSKALKLYGMGWLSTGVAAAVFSDLGFQPRAGAGLFQLISAPGLLAHGLELANKPITAMPFVDDEHYVIEKA